MLRAHQAFVPPIDGLSSSPNRLRRFSVSGRPATSVARAAIALLKRLLFAFSSRFPELIARIQVLYSLGSLQYSDMRNRRSISVSLISSERVERFRTILTFSAAFR